MRVLVWCAVSLVLAAQLSPAIESTTAGKRLVVIDPDDGLVRVAAREIFGKDLALGDGVRRLIADELKRHGYSVIGWKAFDQALTAQGFPPDRRTEAQSQRVSQAVAGMVDGVVLGTILQLGHDTKSGIMAIGPSGETAPFSSTQELVAAIGLRLMNARTGEVMLACEGRGVAKGAAPSVFRPKGGGRISGLGVDFASPAFAKSMPGEAIIKAVNQAVAHVTEAQWTTGEESGAPGPASELLAALLVQEIKVHRERGFDEDRAIVPSPADLRTGRTVYIEPMAFNFHLDFAYALSRAQPPLFQVVDDPRTADLWIRGTAGFTGALKIFGAELTIVPRGSDNVLWSGKARSGGYDPRKETESGSLADKLVRRIQNSMGLSGK